VERINARLAWITDGAVTAYSQVAKMSGWVNERVNFGSSLAEGLVEEYLAVAKDAPPDVIEVLNLRLEGASAAVKKYVAAVNLADADDRIRESTKYYGAATGRWSGAGIQPHNMKRSKTPDESYYQAIATGDYDLCALLWDNPIDLLKKSVRGIICAPPGRKLVVSDFANIEARVLAWLAGQESMLKTFRASQDVYIASACEIFGYPPADIADWDGHKWKIKAKHSINGVKCSDMRQLGKGCVLGLGYGMGAAKFAANVRIQQGLDLDPEFVEGVVKAWRTTNSAITRLWANLNNACIRAIQSKGQGFRVGKLLAYWHKRGYLCIRLPSGRDLFYYQAKLGPPNQWGNPEIMYLDGSKGNAKNAWTKTYGGKLAENVTQAVSRDPLVHSMQLIDRGGFDLVLHVHDESVSEVDAGDQDAKPFIHNAMQTLPPWAEGLPLEAETYESRRYTK
jgi:DNA polymerase